MFNEAANHSDLRVHALSKATYHTPVKRLDPQLTSKDAIREVGSNAIELDSLAPSPHAESSLLDRPQLKSRAAWKQERKRIRIRRREEMKFSHSIQFNAVPDWSSHYISYSNLKKLYAFRGDLAVVSAKANPPELRTD